VRIDLSRVHFKPFTKVVPTKALLPGTVYYFEITPVAIAAFHFQEQSVAKQMAFEMGFRAIDMIVEQDLKRQSIAVSVKTKKGVFSYKIRANEKAVALKVTRLSFPVKLMTCGKERSLKKGEEIELLNHKKELALPGTLHMGCFKKQDWNKVINRFSLVELLPFLFELGKLYPKATDSSDALNPLKQALKNRDKNELEAIFATIYQENFDQLLVPDFSRKHYFSSEQREGKESVSNFLHELHVLIRELFVHYEKGTLKLLNLLPKKCIAGQIEGLKLGEELMLSFRWSKSKLFFVEIEALRPCTVTLDLKEYKGGYRLREAKERKGKRTSQEMLSLNSGQRVFLDRWEA
jgi:hypothetical protein